MRVVITVMEKVLFHRTTFQNPAFFSMDFNRDVLKQVVPDAILQSQPKLGAYHFA